MKRYYSHITGNCYLENGPAPIPPEAIEISDERYEEVIANPDPAKVRSHDGQGLPILIDPPVAVLTGEELAAIERAWRDGEVSSTEWLVTRHRDEQDMQLTTTLHAEQFAELLEYRQGLRDWPQSEHFPAIEYRPVAPPWLAEQSQ